MYLTEKTNIHILVLLFIVQACSQNFGLTPETKHILISHIFQTELQDPLVVLHTTVIELIIR